MTEKQPDPRTDTNEPQHPETKPLSLGSRLIITGLGTLTAAACIGMGVNAWHDLNPEESAIVAGVPGRIEQVWYENEGCAAQVGVNCAQETYVQIALITQCPQDVTAFKDGADVATYNPVVEHNQTGCIVDEVVIGDDPKALRVGMLFTPSGAVGEMLYRPS